MQFHLIDKLLKHGTEFCIVMFVQERTRKARFGQMLLEDFR